MIMTATQTIQQNGTNKPDASAPITQLSASQLAARINKGELTAVEAVETCIARIEAVNPALNAVVVKRYQAARAEAREADARRARGDSLGPLHGVPVTIKECLDVTDTPSTFGLTSRASHKAEKDDVYVARLRQAGAIVVGKTNVAQLLIYAESDNPVYGRSNNPWNVERSCGGSSGGEGAIIATGGSPLGLGTDIGGSLRIPAAFCGITSMKPTANRTPDNGRFSVPIGQRAVVSQVGTMARTVEDVTLGLQIINGNHLVPLGDPKTVDISRLRVAYYTDDGLFQVAPAVRRAVLETAELLKQQGASVTAWTPPHIAVAFGLFYSLLTADGGEGFKQTLGRDKKDPRTALLLLLAGRSRQMLQILSHLTNLLGQKALAQLLPSFGRRTVYQQWQLVENQMNYQQKFEEAMNKDQGGPFDIILCPATSLPAFTHGSTRDLGLAGSYTALYNVLGYPAGVVPVTRVRPGEEVGRNPSRDMVEKVAWQVETGSTGLPIAVQVVARPWQEHKALAAMQVIQEKARLHADYPDTSLLFGT